MPKTTPNARPQSQAALAAERQSGWRKWLRETFAKAQASARKTMRNQTATTRAAEAAASKERESAPKANNGRAKSQAAGAAWAQPRPGAQPWDEAGQREMESKIARAMEPRRSASQLERLIREFGGRPPAPGHKGGLEWLNDGLRGAFLRQSLLAEASSNANPEAVRVLLGLGADPNALDEKGCGALWHAMKTLSRLSLKSLEAIERQKLDEAMTQCAQTLLDAGADPNGWGQGVLVKEPVLWAAAGHRHEALTEMLLEAGARPDALDEQGSPLLGDLAGNSPKNIVFFERLIAAGAQIDATDAQGKTALHHAAQWHNVEAAKELRRLGANETLRDLDGRVWQDVARQRAQELPGAPEASRMRAYVESLEIKKSVDELPRGAPGLAPKTEGLPKPKSRRL